MCVLQISVDESGSVGGPLLDLLDEEHSLTFSVSWSGFIVQPRIESGIVFPEWCSGSAEIFVEVDDKCVCWSVFGLFWRHGWRSLSSTGRGVTGCFRVDNVEDEIDICSSVFSFLLGLLWSSLNSVTSTIILSLLCKIIDMKLILKLCVILVDCQSELGNYLKLIKSQLYNENDFQWFYYKQAILMKL